MIGECLCYSMVYTSLVITGQIYNHRKEKMWNLLLKLIFTILGLPFSIFYIPFYSQLKQQYNEIAEQLTHEKNNTIYQNFQITTFFNFIIMILSTMHFPVRLNQLTYTFFVLFFLMNRIVSHRNTAPAANKKDVPEKCEICSTTKRPEQVHCAQCNECVHQKLYHSYLANTCICRRNIVWHALSFNLQTVAYILAAENNFEIWFNIAKRLVAKYELTMGKACWQVIKSSPFHLINMIYFIIFALVWLCKTAALDFYIIKLYFKSKKEVKQQCAGFLDEKNVYIQKTIMEKYYQFSSKYQRACCLRWFMNLYDLMQYTETSIHNKLDFEGNNQVSGNQSYKVVVNEADTIVEDGKEYKKIDKVLGQKIFKNRMSQVMKQKFFRLLGDNFSIDFSSKPKPKKEINSEKDQVKTE